jgi:hypothetical protein
MTRTNRRLVLLAGVLAMPLIPAVLEAQVPAALAEAFMGCWDVALQGEVPATIQVDITDASGHAAAEVTGVDGVTRSVAHVTKRGKMLILRYTTQIEGNPTAVAITLTPDGQGLHGVIDLANGMYSAPIRGIRRAAAD